MFRVVWKAWKACTSSVKNLHEEVLVANARDVVRFLNAPQGQDGVQSGIRGLSSFSLVQDMANESSQGERQSDPRSPDTKLSHKGLDLGQVHNEKGVQSTVVQESPWLTILQQHHAKLGGVLLGAGQPIGNRSNRSTRKHIEVGQVDGHQQRWVPVQDRCAAK